MHSRRWRHIDREKPAPSTPESDDPSPSPTPSTPPAPAVDRSSSPELAPARALYSLGALEECVKLLLPLADRAAPPSGTRRLLGLALGRLGQLHDAMGFLSAAVAEDPGDALLRASLLSAEILAGQLPEPPATLAVGPLSELAGAAAWLQGQALLRDGSPALAAANFQQASLLLGSDPPGSMTAERASAAFIGEAVSRLAAGQLEAAQQCYLRLPGRERLPEKSAQFARQLYEVADALQEIEPAERPELLQPLVELVTAARLRVRFFDQEGPVEIWWDHLP